MQKLLFIASSFLVFVLFNYGIYEKEQLKANGETVLLELAPVDPRSLMQGDYMQLRYAVERSANKQVHEKHGYMVIAVDANHIGSFKRIYQGEPLAADEKLLRFHKRYGVLRIVPDSFMFQEGHADLYSKAKYGVFKFGDKGRPLLIGLADDKLGIITPQ